MYEWLGSALTATVISSAVTAFGWFITSRNQRGLDRDRRSERVLDFQTALVAEIKTNQLRFGGTDLAVHAAEMQQQILSSDQAFNPFVPRYPGIIVFEAVLQEIHILPTETIQEVIAYYKQQYELRDLIEDLRSVT